MNFHDNIWYHYYVMNRTRNHFVETLPELYVGTQLIECVSTCLLLQIQHKECDECVCCRGFPDPLPADSVHRRHPGLLPGDCAGTVHEAGRGLCLEHRTPLQRYPHLCIERWSPSLSGVSLRALFRKEIYIIVANGERQVIFWSCLNCDTNYTMMFVNLKYNFSIKIVVLFSLVWNRSSFLLAT